MIGTIKSRLTDTFSDDWISCQRGLVAGTEVLSERAGVMFHHQASRLQAWMSSVAMGNSCSSMKPTSALPQILDPIV